MRVNPVNGDAAAAGQAVASAAGLTYATDLGNGYVVLAARSDPSRAAAARAAIASAMERGRGGGPPDTTPLGQAVAAAKVSSAEEDYIVLPLDLPNECNTGSCGAGLWGLNTINMRLLWGSIPSSLLPVANATRVSIIDTGVMYTHVELSNQFPVVGISVRAGRTVSGAGADDQGHGTHVAGSIAGKWGGAPGSIAGVNGRTGIVSCKFLWSSGGYTSDAILCLNHARQNNALISNNSWGGGGYLQPLRDAILAYCQAGGLFVAAAGNDYRDTTGTYPADYGRSLPADLNCVLPVAAIDSTKTLASFSNYGPSVPVAAPGVSIRSSVWNSKSNTREAYYSGTSMATPHVTGVAIFLKNSFQALNGTMIKKAIVDSAKEAVAPYNGFSTRNIGGGLLDAMAAYETASAMSTNPVFTGP